MDNKEKLTKLVQRFEEHLDDLKHKDYKEMQLCTDYINPLFAMLGWDIENERDSAEKFRDVVQQYRLAIGSTSKAPDYLFRIGGTPVFFVEAKKPSVDINSAKDPAFQLRRYGWNKKEVDISILTDFEDFSVYNCQIKPQEGDEPHVGRIARYTYKQYLTHWEEIESMFSRASVEKGSLDKLLKEKSIKGIKETVDESFLKMIEDWRDMLARNLALRNPELDVKQLNYAVQQTIDRIIFLRIAEDRGIEPPNQLEALKNGTGVYGRLIEHFKLADQRYNSGLFHFVQEKAIKTQPDNLSLTLSIDDKVLKDMIVNLYPPKSPYDFSAMPADILGQVYERFLGKVIRLTDGHRAVVDEKPEVRKAGGVYYTPTYIVDYIVQNTVGKLVEGKTPAEVAKLRILDPACGSGSFLIGAYQFLLDWHIEYYKANDPEKHAKGKNPPICQLKLADGTFGWKLTTEKRKEILLNNIYGVDIDRQAVEVTKLNLLLKVLEEGHVASLIEKMQRALPDLGSNIKCGNSLIESDFYTGKQGLFDMEEKYRINTFDWDREFPEIIKWGNNAPMQTPQPPLKKGGPDAGTSSPPLLKDDNSTGTSSPPLLKGGRGVQRVLAEGFGFDAVIGNPPYIDSEWMSKFQPETRDYCNTRYVSASGNWDIFCIFINLSLLLLKQNGFSSMIIPNKLSTAEYARNTRNIISQNRLESIRDFSSVSVFPVSVYPIVYVVNKNLSKKKTIIYEKVFQQVMQNLVIHNLDFAKHFSIELDKWILTTDNNSSILQKVKTNKPLLREICDVLGAATVSEAYELQEYISDKNEDYSIKIINSGTIDRYASYWGIADMRYLGKKYKYPVLINRNLEFISKKRLQQSKQCKIIISGMTKRLECFIDLKGEYLAGKSTSILLNFMKAFNYFYLLGILNSNIISYYYKNTLGGNSLSGGYLRIGPPQLKLLPIKEIDFKNKKDVERHDAMVRLVEQMLELNKRLQQAKTPDDKELLSRQIEATDRQIDGLVYELYELTPEEIALVEESTK